MNWPRILSLFGVAYLAIFAQSRFAFVPGSLGAQLDLLPALIVYTGLTASLPVVTAVVIVSGFAYDSLCAHPLGFSLVALGAIGLSAHAARDILLRDDVWTQYLLGLAACAVAPLVTLGLLVGAGLEPLYGGWFAWRWLVSAALSAGFTPLCFRLFAKLDLALNYPPEPSAAFRPDREIDRGRDHHVPH
jgi:cell shape-determining protein MreD